MTTTTATDSDSASLIGPRLIGDTGVTVHPVAIDGSIFGWAAGQADTIRVLDLFSGAGGDLISTADHYAGGRSEIMIGHWVRMNRNREKVTLATKVGRHPDSPGLSASAINRAVDASLQRLETDRIDFLSLDGEHPETPIEETLAAVDDIIRAGKVRFLAAAAYGADRISEFQSVAASRQLPEFKAFIAEYNLMDRQEYETAIAPIATALGNSGIAKLPLASGYLTGQFRTRDDIPDSVMFGGAMRHIGRKGNKVLAALETVAGEAQISLATAAIAWVLIRPGVAAAAVRAKDPEQITEHLAAANVQLSRQHVSLLDEASAY